MKKLFTKLQIITGLSVIVVFSCISCVNEEYDLSKGVDTDMLILHNTTLPIGSTRTVGLFSRFTGNNQTESSIFRIDENGDMSLRFGSQSLSHSFSVPQVSFGGDGGLMTSSIEVGFSIPDDYTDLPADAIAGILQQFGIDKIYCTPSGNPLSPDDNCVNESTSFNLDKKLPDGLLSIRTVDMDAVLKVTFLASESTSLHIEKGFTVEFPDFIVLDVDGSNLPYEVQDGCKVVFIDDTVLSDESPLVLNLKFTRLQGLDEMIMLKKDASGKLGKYITKSDGTTLRAYGNVFIDPADYGKSHIPSAPTLHMDVDMENLVMTAAEVMLDMDYEIEDQVVSLGDLHNIFSGKGIIVDFYNPIIKFKVTNNSPLQLNLNAEISSQLGDNITDIHIGDNCKHDNQITDAIVIPAEGVAEYYFSRQGYHNTKGGKDIKVEKLGDIIVEMPELFMINDIKVETEDKFISVVAEEKYDVQIDLNFETLMAFGKNLNIGFEHDFNVNFKKNTYGVGSLVLSMNMLNTIPLDLKLQCLLIDDKGELYPGGAVDFMMNAGTIDNPTLTPAEIRFGSSSATEVAISKLRFHISASSNESIQGKVLNNQQGLAIKDIVLTLPDGVKVDLSENIVSDLLSDEE